MNVNGKDRCEMLGEYLITNKATVRSCASYFGVSKSTVHKDLTGKLMKINRALYTEVKAVLDTNKSERHLRGGEATRRKYLIERLKSKKET